MLEKVQTICPPKSRQELSNHDGSSRGESEDKDSSSSSDDSSSSDKDSSSDEEEEEDGVKARWESARHRL
jgi:hypothetical protein